MCYMRLDYDSSSFMTMIRDMNRINGDNLGLDSKAGITERKKFILKKDDSLDFTAGKDDSLQFIAGKEKRMNIDDDEDEEDEDNNVVDDVVVNVDDDDDEDRVDEFDFEI